MISALSNNDLFLISRMNMFQLHELIKGKTIHESLLLRKHLQIALAAYAKHTKYDRVQEKILVICQKIEKWCRLAYMKERLKLEVAKLPKDLKKKLYPQIRAVKNDFEILVKGNSY